MSLRAVKTTADDNHWVRLDSGIQSGNVGHPSLGVTMNMREWAQFCLKEMDTLDKFLFLFGLGFSDHIHQWTITEKLSQTFSTTHGISQPFRGGAPQVRPITPRKAVSASFLRSSLSLSHLLEPAFTCRGARGLHTLYFGFLPPSYSAFTEPIRLSQPVTHPSISFLTHHLPTQPLSIQTPINSVTPHFPAHPPITFF